MAWLSGHNMGAQKQHPGLHKVYKKYLSSFLFECQIASRVEFKVTLVTFNFTFLMSNHFTFCRSFKVTLVTFTCIFTHAFLQITSYVDFKAMLVTFNFTFFRVSPQITCRKGFKVAVVTFEFICFRSIQITSRRTFKVTWSHLLKQHPGLHKVYKKYLSHWSHLTLLFLCQIILPVADHSKLHWSHLLVLLLMRFFKSPLV